MKNIKDISSTKEMIQALKEITTIKNLSQFEIVEDWELYSIAYNELLKIIKDTMRNAGEQDREIFYLVVFRYMTVSEVQEELHIKHSKTIYRSLEKTAKIILSKYKDIDFNRYYKELYSEEHLFQQKQEEENLIKELSENYISIRPKESKRTEDYLGEAYIRYYYDKIAPIKPVTKDNKIRVSNSRIKTIRRMEAIHEREKSGYNDNINREILKNAGKRNKRKYNNP